jgi:hypothetical protein
MTREEGQEMVTLPRELIEQMVHELGQWHDALIVHEVRDHARRVAICGAKVWKLLREQYPIEAFEPQTEREESV